MALKKTVFIGLIICSLISCLEASSLACQSGTIKGYAFCCCKEIAITSSITPKLTTISSTPALPATPSINATSFRVASSSPILVKASASSLSPPSSTLAPPPKPNVFNDSCYVKVDKSYGAYNECYCGYTRRSYAAFNGTVYSNSHNESGFEYKCWNLPKPKLYIGGLFDGKADVGRRILPAAEIAIEEVNDNTAILPGYDLTLLKHNTTKGFISTGSGVLLDYLNNAPKKVALLGPDDDELAKSVAAIAGLPRYKLLQISYGTSAVELALEHDIHYPYFFRTKPQLDLLYNLARVEMLQKFSWNEIALLHTKDSYYSKLNDVLRTVITSKGMNIAIEEEFINDPRSALEHIKRNNIHVILGTFSADDTNKVLCEAYKLKMYGPRYVYLFIGSVQLNGIRGCTTEHVTCAARYQFFFDKKDHSGCSPSIKNSFDAKYIKRINSTYFNTTVSPIPAAHEYGAYTYDAIYAIARALHSTDTNKTEHSKFYHDYVYGSDQFGGKIKDKILKYDQCGASGKVMFDPNGNRYFELSVLQTTFGSQKYIGTFDNRANAGSKLNIIPIWPGNEPYKKTETVSIWRFISKELYIIYCIFAALGIIFAIFCLVVLIWKRKHKEIRYSFYLMNIVIIIGCILVYISVFLFGVDHIISPILVVDRICRARLWVFSIGFILALGGIISKLWLAHDVLSKRLLMKKRKRQKIMFGIVIIMFLITLILLICWHEINPLHRVIEYIRKEAQYACDTDIWPDNPFTVDMAAVEQCKCTNEIVWYFVMVIWKAFVLLIAVTWAYQTRKVFLITVNDTQRCGLCAFIIAACSLVGLIIALTTRLLPDVFFGILGLIIIGCVTAVLIILFLHKILLVFQSTRRKLVSHNSATEDDDDKNCFSRCLSRMNCCSKCCRGNCPKCFRCCVLFCAPCLACLSWIFGCCSSCCRNCCCGSKNMRKGGGTERAGEQKFIVNGIGNDNNAELARLQREVEMKNIYINRLKQTNRPMVTPIWTQTTEPVAYLSDYEADDKNNKDGSNKKKRDAKKRSQFKMFNQKLDFSNIQSRTDSNYKNDGKTDNRVLVLNNQNQPPKEEIDRLKYLLAERDAELNRLRYGSGKANEFELKEIDDAIEKDMKKGLKKNKESNVDKIGGDDYDALLKEFNVDGNRTSPGRPHHDRSNVKISHQKLDWSQVPSKLAATGAIGNSRGTSPFDGEKPKETGGKKNRVSPAPGDSPFVDVAKDAGKDKEKESPSYGANKGAGNSKSKDAPLSDSSNDLGKDRPNESGSNPALLNVEVGYNNGERRRSSVKIFSKGADYSHIKSSLTIAKTDKKPDAERRRSSVRILNAPKNYNHVKSKLVPDTSPKAKSENPGDTSPRDKPNSDVKIVSDPKDYSHVKSKLIPDSTPKAKPDSTGGASPRDKPSSDVKIVSDPKDYSHVKSKLIPDSTPKAKPDSTGGASPRDKPSSDVKIVSDPKDYSHVKSKLIPDSAPKPKSDNTGDASPRDKPNSDVKILDDPKNYSHIKSTLGASTPVAATKKSTVKIVNKPVDFSHVKSKLA